MTLRDRRKVFPDDEESLVTTPPAAVRASRGGRGRGETLGNTPARQVAMDIPEGLRYDGAEVMAAPFIPEMERLRKPKEESSMIAAVDKMAGASHYVRPAAVAQTSPHPQPHQAKAAHPTETKPFISVDRASTELQSYSEAAVLTQPKIMLRIPQPSANVKPINPSVSIPRSVNLSLGQNAPASPSSSHP